MLVYRGHLCRSRSSGQGQSHRNKDCICVSYSATNAWMSLPTNFIFGMQGTSLRYLGEGRISRSQGQGQGHAGVTKYTFIGGLSLSERQPCLMDWLKVNETVESSSLDKIHVCVRKRPRTTREVKRNETDIVKVQGHQTVIVEELKVAVDLTKFMQQVLSIWSVY